MKTASAADHRNGLLNIAALMDQLAASMHGCTDYERRQLVHELTSAASTLRARSLLIPDEPKPGNHCP